MDTKLVDTSYEPFSYEPEYIEGNRQFVRLLPFRPAKHVLDLACGVGTITELILEIQPNITIWGLDLSRESLTICQKHFRDKGFKVEDGLLLSGESDGGHSRLVLLEGTADQLPFRDDWADVVFMGHAIHMLSDSTLLLSEVHRVLLPQGVFAFNSSFYAGSQAPGTDHFYQIWWKGALNRILKKDAELRKQGKPGIKRKRGTAPRAFSAAWPSKQEWNELLREHGFIVDMINERTIMMTQSSLETIGAYSGLARLMLSGYPVELASEALAAAAGPAMQEVGVDAVPRLWLEIVARKG